MGGCRYPGPGVQVLHPPQARIPRQSLSREKPMRPLRQGEHLWCLKFSQVYSNNESKTNLAATRKPLQPHVSSQMCSQSVSAKLRPSRLTLEVPHTLSVTPCCGSIGAADAPSFLPNKPCPRSTVPAQQGAPGTLPSPLTCCQWQGKLSTSILQPFFLHYTLP